MKTSTHCQRGFTLVEIMIVVAIIGLLASIAIPNFIRARDKAKQTACIQNLTLIDGAKSQWSMEHRVPGSAQPQESDLQPYIGRGTAGKLPTCPADSANTFTTSYRINDLQTNPECLIQPGVPGDTGGHRIE